MNKVKEGRGRKITREYFNDFDALKNIGDTFLLNIKEGLTIQQFQVKMFNQARSYSKANEVEFKILTREENNILVIQRIK